MVCVNCATFLKILNCHRVVSNVEVIDTLHKEEIWVLARWDGLSFRHHYHFQSERVKMRSHIIEGLVVYIKVTKHLYFCSPLLLWRRPWHKWWSLFSLFSILRLENLPHLI